MNSSTSVSKISKRSILTAIIMILFGEFVVRLAGPLLSGNAMHIKEIPMIAGEMAQNQGKKLLFLGNSVINNGIDIDIINAEFQRCIDGRAFATKINPDSSELLEWYFIYKNYFLRNTIVPDVVLIGFVRDWLEDHRQVNPSRLASGFCRLNNFPDLTNLGLKRPADIKEFLLASMFSLYADRETIRNRVLDSIVPFYRGVAATINRSTWVKGKMNCTGSNEVARYKRLENFLKITKINGSQVMLIAMPTRDKYTISDELLMVAEMYGSRVIDMRNIIGLMDTHFFDSVHLIPEGAKIVSHELVGRLMPMLFQNKQPYSVGLSGFASGHLATQNGGLN